MEIELDLRKTVDENAIDYFERAKGVRKKIAGLEKYIAIAEKKRAEDESKKEKIVVQEKKVLKWFQKFRWFFSSDGFLIVGGRDAQGNEEIVKKKMKKNDVYFHADVFGAPHCIIVAPESVKSGEFLPLQSSLVEAAQFAATFSKAWEEGRPIADVYSVKPEQVSKSAKSGESMGTGAFMIYGERNWFRKTSLSCAIGYYPQFNCLMSGPLTAVKKNCKFFFELKQGKKSKDETAKELKLLFEKKGFNFLVDEIVSLLPNGNFSF